MVSLSAIHKSEIADRLKNGWASESSCGNLQSFPMSTEPLSDTMVRIRAVGIGDRAFAPRQNWIDQWAVDADHMHFSESDTKLWSQINRRFDVIVAHGDDGVRLSRIVREVAAVLPSKSIICVMAERDRATMAKLLMAGADEALWVGQSPEEAAVRVRAVLRRKQNSLQRVIDKERLPLDSSVLWRECAWAHFSEREQKVLHLLESRIGKIVTYSELLRKMSPLLSGNPCSVLRVVISKIRQRIPNDFTIRNFRDSGYVLSCSKPDLYGSRH